MCRGTQLARDANMRGRTKVLVGAIGLVGLGVVVARIASARFQRGVAHDVRDLLSVPTSGVPVSPSALPPPVARYRERAVGDHAPISVARMHHVGSFRPTAGGTAYPIAGSQVFTTDPPGFVWTADVRLGPATWFSARDLSIGGKGDMRVLVDAMIPVVDARGPALDEGAMLRLLAEMAWYPTAYFDARYVTWSPIGDDRALATLHAFGRDVSATFTFDDSGLLVRCDAERPDDRGVRKPWGGVYGHYHQVDGLAVPFEAKVFWQLPTGTFTYAHWRLDMLEFETGPVLATAPPS